MGLPHVYTLLKALLTDRQVLYKNSSVATSLTACH